MAKLSVVAVLLLVVVPLSMYTCALLLGVQLGRALERGPDNNSGGCGSVEFTWRGALDYVTKEIWDIYVYLGRRRGGREPVVVASRSTGGVKRSSSSSLRQEEEALKPLPNLPSAYDVPKTKSRAKDNSRTQRHYNRTSPRGVITVLPSWGGIGGQPFSMNDPSTPRLRSITLYHSGAIHSLSIEYVLAGENDWSPPRVAGPWGRPDSFSSQCLGSSAVRTKIKLRSGEHITGMEGTTGRFANVPGMVVTSLTFRTSAGRTYGPYGNVLTAGDSSRYFSVPVLDGGCIVGFWGRSGWLVDRIGVYTKFSCSPSSPSSDTAAYKKYASRRQGRN